MTGQQFPAGHHHHRREHQPAPLRHPVIHDRDPAPAPAVRLRTKLPGPAPEDVGVDYGAADRGVRPLVALPRPDPAGDIRALGALTPALTLVVHLVETRGEIRPQIRTTLREVGRRRHHTFGRQVALYAKLDPRHRDNLSSPPRIRT